MPRAFLTGNNCKPGEDFLEISFRFETEVRDIGYWNDQNDYQDLKVHGIYDMANFSSQREERAAILQQSTFRVAACLFSLHC